MSKKLNMTGGLGDLIPTSKPKEKAPEPAQGSLEHIAQLADYLSAVKRLREAGEIGAVGRPRRKDKDNTKARSAEKGTKPGEMRKTYLVKIGTADKLERIAYWDRRKVKDVVNDALAAYVTLWEKRNGAPKEVKK